MKTYLLPFCVLFFVNFNAEKLLAQDPRSITLNNYRPKSIYNIPVSHISKARYPVIDMHSHDYALTQQDIDQWVMNMDKAGIEKTILLTFQTGAGFDSVVEKYSQYPDRFEIWCGFDYSGYEKDPDWTIKAVKELERCFNKGAKGVGELGDKGLGEIYSKPVPGIGLHIDDPKMKPLLQKCAELGMPVNIHVAESYWMYCPMDSTNDGLMNAYTWRVDLTKPGILNHEQLIQTLENAVRDNPKTTFIACHFANCDYNLSILGRLLDTYPNLYADISARYAETAPIPRTMSAFYQKYQDRLLYGTDMGFDSAMYSVTFRILESLDDHFYEIDLFGYHWPLYGFGLPDAILEKIYHTNALAVLKK
jgi:predicted TIM-barrel fold metal-dependent hydrolase